MRFDCGSGESRASWPGRHFLWNGTTSPLPPSGSVRMRKNAKAPLPTAFLVRTGSSYSVSGLRSTKVTLVLGVSTPKLQSFRLIKDLAPKVRALVFR